MKEGLGGGCLLHETPNFAFTLPLGMLTLEFASILGSSANNFYNLRNHTCKQSLQENRTTNRLDTLINKQNTIGYKAIVEEYKI